MIGWNERYSVFRHIEEINGEKYIKFNRGLEKMREHDEYKVVSEEEVEIILNGKLASCEYNNDVDDALFCFEGFKKRELACLYI